MKTILVERSQFSPISTEFVKNTLFVSNVIKAEENMKLAISFSILLLVERLGLQSEEWGFLGSGVEFPGM